MTACDKDANLISKQYDIPSELELYYLTLECGCAGEDEAAAFLSADACCCDTGCADVLVRSGSERGRSRSHVECLFSSVTHQGITGQSLMTWDADGNRVSFTSSTNPGNPHAFVYDTTAGIPAVIEEVKPSGATGGSGTVYYVREPDGTLIVRVEGATVQYYHCDALGSTRLITNSTGAVTDTYTYDAWGVTSHDSGSASQPYQFVGQLGYYTHYQDTNLPMLQLGVRYYDPSLGRFTQMDTFITIFSSYCYCNNCITNGVDPNGTDIRKRRIVGPIIDWLTEGQFCVSSSCEGNSILGNNMGGIQTIRSLDYPDQTSKLGAPPEPLWIAPIERCPELKRTDVVHCYLVDAISIPTSLALVYNGVPQRPQGATVLKIPNLAKCTLECDRKKPTSAPTLSCNSREDHPAEWLQ